MAIPISCKCITYGRVDLLEESLYSFLNQEYDGDSEMVIVNDHPEQKLYFDHPKVKIINFDKTFETIGAKENFAVENCSYNTIEQGKNLAIEYNKRISQFLASFYMED